MLRYLIIQTTNSLVLFVGILSFAVSIANAITVNSVGITATQVILSYNAPNSNACTIVVKENTNTLVNDLNSALFSGASQDTARGSSIVNGVKRVVVIGKRAAEKAIDGKYYSRALQTDTQHSFVITCNGGSASGSFTTQNIPLGNTYNEALPVDPSAPGQYAWPTLDLANTSQRVIDPQTGVLITPFSVRADGGSVGWGPASTTRCAPKPVTDGNGKQGALCSLPSPNPASNQPALYFAGFDGTVRMIGVPHTHFGWNNLPEEYCAPIFDSNDPTLFRCVWQNTGNYLDPHWGKIGAKGKYIGDFRASDPSWRNDEIPVCDTSTTSNCVQWSFVMSGPPTQSATIDELFKQKVPQHQPYLFGGLAGIQGDRYWVFYTTWGSQNSEGWVYVLDEQQQQIIAWTSTFNQPANGLKNINPLRWGSIHYAGVSPLTGWAKIALDPLYGPGSSLMSLPAGRPGYGPYLVNMTSGAPLMNSMVACPTNIYGRSGEVMCNVVTVDGEPRNPNPQVNPDNNLPEISYTKVAQEGDVVTVSADDISHFEHMRLIKKVGNTWTLLRNLGNDFNWPFDHPGATKLYMACGNTISFGPPGMVDWNYLADPLGNNATGQTLLTEVGSGGHSIESSDNYIVRPFYEIMKGPLEDSWWGRNSTYTVNAAPTFNGLAGVSVPMSTDSHPSEAKKLPTGEAIVIDGRPFNFATNNLFGGHYPGTLVTGSLYKLTTNAYGASGSTPSVTWDPQYGSVYAWCGERVLADVSGPSVLMTGTSSSNYTYCLARNPNECFSGSAKGDLYVNCPGATSTTCDGSSADICFGQNGARIASIVQTDVAQADANGLRSRVLTHGFGRYKHQDIYWNASWVQGSTQPNGFLFNVRNPNGILNPNGWPIDDIYLAKLPPFPTYDSVKRDGHMQIPYTVTPPSGVGANNVIVKFGYNENGTPNQLRCTSRNEPCVKGNQSGYQFGYASDTNIQGLSCAGGCTINLPALPQRILYFQVIYRNASNVVVATDDLRAVASEPPYNISDSGKSLKLPSAPVNLRLQGG